MEIQLYNTLIRKVEPFHPIDPANVRMYVCGPTVYDFAHIGNARPVIVFDVLFRLLRHIYGADHVTYVRNITDVDDKINARAADEYPELPLNEAIRLVTEKTERQFHEDVRALGVLTTEDVNNPGHPPSFIEPRATEHIAEMRAIIEKLVMAGHAYVAEDHVLFSVPSMKGYGRLSNRSLDEMLAGARVEIAPYKRDAMDFVLWKPSKLGEPAWPSPCGIATPGRPGWHIECSAMSDRWLWTEAKSRLSQQGLAHPHQFDIHGGGIDLVFPHHENEIAQSRCAFHTPAMASTWMHNGFLQVEGEKMSKSLGNFLTVSDLRSDWQGEVIRYQMLMTHYRQPIDWTESASREAQSIVDRWYEFLNESDISSKVGPPPDNRIVEALANDLNTPDALGRMASLFESARKDRSLTHVFISTARFLGFLSKSPDEYFQFYREAGGLVPKSSPLVLKEIKNVRDEAKKRRDFITADYLRNIIYLYGFRIADERDGTSRLVAADADYFSVSATTKGKLLRVVRAALEAVSDANESPSFESGFAIKFGKIFNYRSEYRDALSDAYRSLERDIGSGAITEDDLNDVIVDIVLSNFAKAARFGPDLVVAAVLLKLFSGVVRPLDIYFENRLIQVPKDESWSLGVVSIAQSLPPAILERGHASLGWMADATSFFQVKMPSTRAAMKDRAMILVRAFVSATRLLAISTPQDSEVHVPRLGILERDAFSEPSSDKYVAATEDGGMILPGRRARLGYKLSGKFIQIARDSPNFAKMDDYLRLELFRPVGPQLLALDRLTRARVSDDPIESVHWSMESVEVLCRDGGDAVGLPQAFARAIERRDVRPSDVKQLRRGLERLESLRHHIGFVTDRDATFAQRFAEEAVRILLLGDT